MSEVDLPGHLSETLGLKLRPDIAFVSSFSDEMQEFVGACAIGLGGTSEMATLAAKSAV